MPDKYCFDANAFIEPWTKYYSPELVPGYWRKIDQLAQAGRIICPTEVYNEITNCDDGLARWIKDRKDLIVRPSTDVLLQNKVREILRLFPKVIKVQKSKSMADPWVVAQAIVDGAIVVTKEIHGANTDIKIPNVCDHFNVKYINDYAFALRENVFNRI